MLDGMRVVGDPPADAAIEATFAAGQQEGAQTFMADRMTNAAPPPSSLPSQLREFLAKSKVAALPNPTPVSSRAARLLNQREIEVCSSYGRSWEQSLRAPADPPRPGLTIVGEVDIRRVSQL